MQEQRTKISHDHGPNTFPKSVKAETIPHGQFFCGRIGGYDDRHFVKLDDHVYSLDDLSLGRRWLAPLPTIYDYEPFDEIHILWLHPVVLSDPARNQP